ncbi:MAG: hypothetical protein WCG23_09415 [bacterium]
MFENTEELLDLVKKAHSREKLYEDKAFMNKVIIFVRTMPQNMEYSLILDFIAEYWEYMENKI